MSMSVQLEDRIPMSQSERDVLKIMHPVLSGERTRAEAALLGLTVRQVRRIQRKLEQGGDTAIVHGLRGKPSQPPGRQSGRRLPVRSSRRPQTGRRLLLLVLVALAVAVPLAVFLVLFRKP